VDRVEGLMHLVSTLATMGVPAVSPQSTQSTAAVMRLLQEVLELLPESGRQAALRLPWKLMDKIRVRAASTAAASFPSMLG
jgi:nucleoside recognition membrane protein YjiH